MRSTQNNFQTIRSEGGLLPSDLLQRLSVRDPEVPGLSDSSYHLSGEKLNEAINRSWNRLSGAWKAFQAALGEISESDPATSVTRQKWLLPLFEELKYGRLQTSKAKEIEGKSYPVSHGWGHLPIHLIGCRVDLDRRSQGVAGASRSSPHSMVQEFLNRSQDNLWAIVSNGLKLRVLRDNITLTRQAFLEFDLAAMFEGEAYSDFVVLWLICHESRVEAEKPSLCWLEKWSQFAEESGVRALEKLREGVERAIESLGRGFLAHPANNALRQKLSSGELDKQEYYRQLLRIIYRFIFLFVAEDRNLLLRPETPPASRQHYYRFYSLTRLRTLAERRIASQHVDLWQSLSLLFDLLGEKGSKALGLPALGSFLWSDKAIPSLAGANIANRDLLRAIYFLAFIKDGTVRRSVDYKHLGADELGSIYEALLEMHPRINLDAKTFSLASAAGNERKTTGSYYTPTSLVTCLLDSALDPVIAQAAKQKNPEEALLNLKICDPACGSGHFLIAAAHRLAKRLATVRTGDSEP
ncbi:MAG: N-6 DNA methylase, partial [Opitutales bacterium]